MKANLFAYSRHGSDDAGRSPQTKRFFILIIYLNLIQVSQVVV